MEHSTLASHVLFLLPDVVALLANTKANERHEIGIDICGAYGHAACL